MPARRTVGGAGTPRLPRRRVRLGRRLRRCLQMPPSRRLCPLNPLPPQQALLLPPAGRMRRRVSWMSGWRSSPGAPWSAQLSACDGPAASRLFSESMRAQEGCVPLAAMLLCCSQPDTPAAFPPRRRSRSRSRSQARRRSRTRSRSRGGRSRSPGRRDDSRAASELQRSQRDRSREPGSAGRDHRRRSRSPADRRRSSRSPPRRRRSASRSPDRRGGGGAGARPRSRSPPGRQYGRDVRDSRPPLPRGGDYRRDLDRRGDDRRGPDYGRDRCGLAAGDAAGGAKAAWLVLLGSKPPVSICLPPFS